MKDLESLPRVSKRSAVWLIAVSINDVETLEQVEGIGVY